MLAQQVEETLRQRELIEIQGARVRRRGRHFIAKDTPEREALALEFRALFAKGLLDKLALPEADSETYLRNHYLNISRRQLPDRTVYPRILRLHALTRRWGKR